MHVIPASPLPAPSLALSRKGSLATALSHISALCLDSSWRLPWGIHLGWGYICSGRGRRGEVEGSSRRIGVQDGLLGLGPATSIPGALEGVDSDHCLHVPYHFSSLSPAVAVVTSLPPSSSPSMAPTALLAALFPVILPISLPSPFYLGMGDSRPGGRGAHLQPLGFWNIRFAKTLRMIVLSTSSTKIIPGTTSMQRLLRCSTCWWSPPALGSLFYNFRALTLEKSASLSP